MALFRCGSGSGGGGLDIDVPEPDAYSEGSITANGTVNIPVTQKPRLIILTQNRTSGSTVQYYTWVVKPETNEAVQYQKGQVPTDYSSDISTRFPAITNSYVTVKNFNSSGACQYMCLCYY